jgi:hypothetical protein
MGYRDYLLKEEAKDLKVPPALARKLAELVKFGLLEKGSKMINRYISSTGLTVEEYEEAIHKMLDSAASAIERYATYGSDEEEPEMEREEEPEGDEEGYDVEPEGDEEGYGEEEPEHKLEVLLGDEDDEEE